MAETARSLPPEPVRSQLPTRSDALEQPSDSHQDTPEVVRSGQAEIVEVVEEVKEVEVTPFTETVDDEDDSVECKEE